MRVSLSEQGEVWSWRAFSACDWWCVLLWNAPSGQCCGLCGGWQVKEITCYYRGPAGEGMQAQTSRQGSNLRVRWPTLIHAWAHMNHHGLKLDADSLTMQSEQTAGCAERTTTDPSSWVMGDLQLQAISLIPAQLICIIIGAPAKIKFRLFYNHRDATVCTEMYTVYSM